MKKIILNNKKITKSEFLSKFNGDMQRFINYKMDDAIDEGKNEIYFNTDLGLLHIIF